MLFVAFFSLAAAGIALATILITCPGNVCSNTVSVGGQNVTYSWTQNHDLDSSTLKVRFRSGPYAANANPVRFKVTSTKPFSSYATLKNPDPTMSLPPGQAVDVGSLWIERSAPASIAGTTYDFTFELRYDSPSPGPMDLTIEIVQYGAAVTVPQTTLATQRVEFDTNSFTNRDEGELFPNPPYPANYLQCADAIDNDFDYRLDCADSDCLGATILVGTPNRFCESPEVTCNDNLDNDGNGKTDCADPLCNGRPGNPAGDKFCGAENGGGPTHLNCADGFDNDGNAKTDCTDDTAATGCWQSGFQDCYAVEGTDALCTDNIDNDRDQNYSETIDSNPATGIDCRDYDCRCTDASCAAVRHCAISERLRWDTGSLSFVDTPGQCSDGFDNDLDDKKDCADDDCLSSASCARYESWLPPSPLGDGSSASTPSFHFNLCTDGIDNDGDGLTDTLDNDCKNRFGACTPFGYDGLAAQETVNFLSCADGRDNDLNLQTDCAENACRTGGMIGRAGCVNATCGAPAKYDYVETDAAMCAAAEDGAALCGDGVDNDNDGAIDCADLACDGDPHGAALGGSPAGYVCGAESGAARCSDGNDNDFDGNVDCFDSACQDGVTCALRPPAGWTPVSCVTVPHTTSPANIAGGPTQFAHDDRIQANTAYHVRLIGTGSYTSLTIVLGDTIIGANRFPFDASSFNCALSGTNAAQMQYVSTDPKAGTIFGKAGQTINGFDVTLTCTTTSAVPVGPLTYPIAIVAHQGAMVEFGETFASVQVYEQTPPTLPNPAVDAEGIVGGEVDIPVGGTVRFQAKPSNDPSGICRCDFDLNGTGTQSADGTCTTESAPFVNDVSGFQVRASALDGTMNRSATSTLQTIDINVAPSVNRNLFPGTSRTTFAGGMPMVLDATFQTDTASNFPGTCNVYVCTDAFSCVLQTPATVSMVPTGSGTSLLTCLGTYTPPAALSAGKYFVFAETSDNGGDVIRSNMIPFLKCEAADAGTGACADADLDADGVPEGRVTPDSYPVPPAAAPSAPDYPPFGAGSSCDNCVNWPNASQADKDANGIGDSCELGTIGRCQYKQCSNSGTPCGDDSDCSDPDRCIVVHQAMCARNCTVATQATDCNYDPDGNLPLPALVGFCELNWGICEAPGPDEGACCFDNPDCTSNSCVALVQPFIETSGGQIYSAGDLSAGEVPPIDNAAFCLQAGGAISNFTSSAGCSQAGIAPYQQPKSANNYSGSFGVIDVNGILNGKYGPLVTGVNLNAAGTYTLDGKLYKYDPGAATGLTITAGLQFLNGNVSTRGNGTIVVIGDLHINGNITYDSLNASDIKRLASVGWVVLKNPNVCPVSGVGAGCGNVIIDGSVENFIGAVFAEGTIETGDSNVQLRATGMFVAKDIKFQRQFSSRTGGSEKVDFDARVLLNPPPGLSDLSRSLPGFQSVAGQ